MRKQRFELWDDIERHARERAESLSEAILLGTAAVAVPAPAPPAPARPKPSGLAMRLGAARLRA
jgi:hypothetical protein